MLRPEFEFTRREGEELTLSTAVHEAIGAASVCWESMNGTGLFDESRAKEVAAKLIEFVEAGECDA